MRNGPKYILYFSEMSGMKEKKSKISETISTNYMYEITHTQTLYMYTSLLILPNNKFKLYNRECFYKLIAI